MSLGPDIRRLERSYYRRVELSVLIAVAIHAAVMVLAPPYVPRPYRLDERPLRLVLAASGAGGATLSPRGAAPEAPPPVARTVTPRNASPMLARELRYAPDAEQSLPATAQAGPDRTDRGAPGAAGEGVEGSAPEVFYAFDSPPKVIRSVVPEYPAAARSQGAEGTVILNANVDERGRVKRVWVVRATAPEILVQAATDALYRFEFAPGSAHGIPVKCTVAVPFNFRLNLHL